MTVAGPASSGPGTCTAGHRAHYWLLQHPPIPYHPEGLTCSMPHGASLLIFSPV